MLFDPSPGLASFMQLTPMDWDFKTFILVLGIGYIAVSWITEHYVFPKLSKYLGVLKVKISRKPKQRKAYKLVLEHMRALQ